MIVKLPQTTSRIFLRCLSIKQKFGMIILKLHELVQRFKPHPHTYSIQFFHLRNQNRQ